MDLQSKQPAASLVLATRFWFGTVLIGRDGTHLTKQVTQAFANRIANLVK